MYAKVDQDEHIKMLHHLSTDKQVKLACVLSAYLDMYKGTIRTLNIPPVHFKLKPGTKPFHTQPFPIPKVHENLTKEECGWFKKDTLWHHTSDSEWAAPIFIIPKKTGNARVITNFRELNKATVRKPCPLPKTLDILQKMEKFKYATAVD